MHGRVVVGKGVLFREVSSVQECPHREREVPLYSYIYHSQRELYYFVIYVHVHYLDSFRTAFLGHIRTICNILNTRRGVLCVCVRKKMMGVLLW